jgi:opacity protein-like surface antigen
MKRISISLSLGLGLLGALPAHSADWNNGAGGLKDHHHSAGVPVPAPIPVMEHFRWYLRADLGLGLGQTPDLKESGMVYGADGVPPVTTFGMSSSWFTGDFDTFVNGGIGVGVYFSPNVRGDITFDVRTKADVKADGTYSYAADPAIYGGGVPGTTFRVDGRTREATQVRAAVTLANLYWDIGQRGGFSPYIGAGAGFAVRSMDRRSYTDETVINTTPPGPESVNSSRAYGATAKSHEIVPALAVMAGASYPISTGTLLDFNYRFTWIGSSDIGFDLVNPGPGNASHSKLQIGDTIDHQLRAGVRWNIW